MRDKWVNDQVKNSYSKVLYAAAKWFKKTSLLLGKLNIYMYMHTRFYM